LKVENHEAGEFADDVRDEGTECHEADPRNSTMTDLIPFYRSAYKENCFSATSICTFIEYLHHDGSAILFTTGI
jgi:hypothetical protein